MANSAGRLEQCLEQALRLDSYIGACNVQCPESIQAVWSLKMNGRKVHKNAGQFSVL